MNQTHCYLGLVMTSLSSELVIGRLCCPGFLQMAFDEFVIKAPERSFKLFVYLFFIELIDTLQEIQT